MTVVYVLRRIFAILALAAGVSVVVFAISLFLPNDPAVAALGTDATEETIAALREEMGLDRPYHEQYLLFVSRLLEGDLGTSVVTRQPVLDNLLDRYPATIELVVASLLVATIVGVPLGVLSAVRMGRPVDHVTRIGSIVFASTPIFWLGLMLQVVFYGQLGLLPSSGRGSEATLELLREGSTGFFTIDTLARGDLQAFLDVVGHLILPTISLAALSLGMVARMTRSAVLNVLHEDHVRTAHAKGLAPLAVLKSHVLRNAGVPIVTIVGLRLGQLLGGAVLTETIFSWPGVGSYAVTSIVNNDIFAVMGVTITITLLYAVVNLVVDMTYPIFDPRLRT